MKVGFHCNENLNEIVLRKKQEEKLFGKLFWGYGGTLCHPLTQIIPFVADSLQQGIKPFLLMCFTPSKPLNADSRPATEYSLDGNIWQALPKGILVKGSKYALICKGLTKVDFWLPLDSYKVSTGKSKGVSLAEYLKSRVDKACASLVSDCLTKGQNLRISYTAEIVSPYCVFVK